MGELTEAQLAQLVEKAATKGTNNALARMGFDTENHLEAQKDMAFLRQQRQASEQVARVVRRSLIGLAVTGLISLVTVGIQHSLGK